MAVAGLRAGTCDAGLRPAQGKESRQAATSKVSWPASFRFTTGATSSDSSRHDDYSGAGLGGDDAPEDGEEEEGEEDRLLTAGSGGGQRLDDLDHDQRQADLDHLPPRPTT